MLYENLSTNEKGNLTFAGYDTVKLAEAFATPLYVMDEASVRSQCRLYQKAMQQHLPAGSRPLYASKALSCKAIYRIMQQEQMGIDVVSVGEIHTAKAAGFPMENAFFHGNSKTQAAIAYAIEQGVGWIVCDNAQELKAIDRLGKNQKVLLRLTPGIDPHTHAKISTGSVDSKFGAAIATGQAEELVALALRLPNVDLQGYHCHIGSQIFEAQPFLDAAKMMLTFAAEMQENHGYFPNIVNLGGGMAVRYQQTDPQVDIDANIAAIGKTVKDTCKALHIPTPAIYMEPGRSIVAAAGITLYTVTGDKTIPGFKRYVAVDGGMTDNPRYTLYSAPYTVLPANKMTEKPTERYTVAGMCCESGDILQEDVALPKMDAADTLCVLTTGAYNYAMSSNYNRIPRPALIMLGEDGPYTAIRRETVEDLLQYDT